MNLEEAKSHIAFLRTKIRSFKVAGSVRRQDTNIKDIDIVTLVPIDQIVKRLDVVNADFGNKMFRGIVRINDKKVRIDIIHTTREEFPFAMLYFTGNKIMNIKMRKKAKSMGYTLSRYGLTSGKKKIICKTERCIFKALDMPYVSPRNRTKS